MTTSPPSGKIVPIRPPSRARERFDWMAEVLASSLYTDAEARVLIRLALHQNVNTGKLFVTTSTLALGANQSERQVRLTIAKSVRFGSVTRKVHRGRGKANDYNLKNRNRDSGFMGKPESPCTLNTPKIGIGIPPYREELTESTADHGNRPTMDELREKYPDLLKRDP
jgi:hypothetical protein